MLKQVPCVVVVWSRQSVESEWVRAESAWAKERNKLVSVRIHEDLELPLQFYHVQTENMVDWKGTRSAPSFQKLVRDIQKIAGPLPSVSPASGPETLSNMALQKRQKPKLSPTLQIESSPNGKHNHLPPRRRGVFLMIISLAVLALVGIASYYFRPSDDPKIDPCTLPWQQQPTYCP